MTYKAAENGEGASVVTAEEPAYGKGDVFATRAGEIIGEHFTTTRRLAGDTDRRRATILLTEAYLSACKPNMKAFPAADIEFERALWDGLKGLCFDCAKIEREDAVVTRGVRLGREALKMTAPAFMFAQKPLGFCPGAEEAAAAALAILKKEMGGDGKQDGGLHFAERTGGVDENEPVDNIRVGDRRAGILSGRQGAVVSPFRSCGVSDKGKAARGAHGKAQGRAEGIATGDKAQVSDSYQPQGEGNIKSRAIIRKR